MHKTKCHGNLGLLSSLMFGCAQAEKLEQSGQGPTFTSALVDFLLSRRPKPVPVWKSNRRDEIEAFLKRVNVGFLGMLLRNDGFWYRRKARKRLDYVGDRDSTGSRDGRGVCYWPDPPWGGGGEFLSYLCHVL